MRQHEATMQVSFLFRKRLGEQRFPASANTGSERTPRSMLPPDGPARARKRPDQLQGFGWHSALDTAKHPFLYPRDEALAAILTTALGVHALYPREGGIPPSIQNMIGKQ
jgi:hypothetical protein